MKKLTFFLDFDILTNEADPIAANAEVLDALYSMLCALGNISNFSIIEKTCINIFLIDLQKFVIKINSRSILSDLFSYCKIPDELFRPICSSIDKLGKKEILNLNFVPRKMHILNNVFF